MLVDMSKKPSLEQCFEKIESVIDALQSEDVPLEQALKQYEQALEHARIAREQPDTFEAKLEELQMSEDGQLFAQGAEDDSE